MAVRLLSTSVDSGSQLNLDLSKAKDTAATSINENLSSTKNSDKVDTERRLTVYIFFI